MKITLRLISSEISEKERFQATWTDVVEFADEISAAIN